MKAYLIDPKFGTISKFSIKQDAVLESLRKALECDYIDVVRGVIPGHDIWVDDEGLVNGGTVNGFFASKGGVGFPEIFGGKGVVLSYDEDGGTSPATCSKQDVANAVSHVIRIDPDKQQIDTIDFRVI